LFLHYIVNEVKLKEEIIKVNNAIKILFEEKKVNELVKHYTEDCKFIVLPESQTISGRSGKIKYSYSYKTTIDYELLILFYDYRCC
jgi:ketosteroid isomerase-like protein